MKYNLLVKRKKDFEYIITDLIATRLNKKQFEQLQSINQDKLGEYSFIAYKDTDFCWWSKVDKVLTPTKIKRAYFEIDYFGNITQYKNINININNFIRGDFEK